MNNSLPSGYKPTDEEAQFYIEINMSNINNKKAHHYTISIVMRLTGFIG
jgi:hypothetical protein